MCCENKPNYKTVESRSQTSNLLAKEEPLRLGAHSTHCFCFLFLESMTPTRPTAARPTPVMPMILVASLTCNREGSGSGSVSRMWDQAVHWTGSLSSWPLTCPLHCQWPDLRANQYWQGQQEKRAGREEKWTEPAGLGFTWTQNGNLNSALDYFKHKNLCKASMERTV